LSANLQRTLAQGPITAFQLAVIALCIGLNMLDGFDVLAMSFAASGVKADGHLLDSQLGALLSAGLVGMGLGSLTLGPCADRWGRRIIVLLSAAFAGLGMLGSSGALLDRGWLPAQLYFFFSAPFVVAAVAISLIGPARARSPA
jgi:MFS transporter, AAHS family, vanillate permease